MYELRGNPVKNLVCSREPSCYGEVLSYRGAEQQAWLGAMKTEFNLLFNNKVFLLAKLPEGRKPIICKLVFKAKN